MRLLALQSLPCREMVAWWHLATGLAAAAAACVLLVWADQEPQQAGGMPGGSWRSVCVCVCVCVWGGAG